MRLPKTPRWAFLVGFATGLLVAGGIWAASNAQFSGGQVSDSPDGRHALSVSSQLGDSNPNAFHVRLFDRASGHTLQELDVKLQAGSSMPALREGPKAISWSDDSTHVDIGPDGAPIIRVYVY